MSVAIFDGLMMGRNTWYLVDEYDVIILYTIIYIYICVRVCNDSVKFYQVVVLRLFESIQYSIDS